MLSMPPATTISAEPAQQEVVGEHRGLHARAAHLVDRRRPADSGSPAPSAAWRAGAWPRPAGRRSPSRISSTLSASIPARSTAAEMARAPSARAGASFKSPRKPPSGVRAAPMMTMGSVADIGLASLRFKTTFASPAGAKGREPSYKR